MGSVDQGLRRMAAALGAKRAGPPIALPGGLGPAPLRVALDGTDVVLKRYRSADAAVREWRTLQHVASCDLRTPAPLALDLAGDWFGEPAIVMEALPGRAGYRVEPGWIEACGRALAAIHATPADEPPTKPTRMLASLSETKRTSGVAERVAAAAARLVLDLADPVFSHGDFHPGNVLSISGGIDGVIDWEDAATRSRPSDIAYCRGVLSVHPGGTAPDVFANAYASELGRPIDTAAWDALWGMRGVLGADRHWPAALHHLGVNLAPATIKERSELFVDKALRTLGEQRTSPSRPSSGSSLS